MSVGSSPSSATRLGKAGASGLTDREDPGGSGAFMGGGRLGSGGATLFGTGGADDIGLGGGADPDRIAAAASACIRTTSGGIGATFVSLSIACTRRSRALFVSWCA
ncbi:MAG: hypothetical protein ACRELY_08915, partial [Polyangiaceae bacterium]